ncbi:MAG: MarR family winged helix-turn-helix transcriptional regulator [Acidimicrobiia bacterium]
MSRSDDADKYLTSAELRAWHGCLVVTNTTVRALDVALADAHGISAKEFDVLAALSDAPNGRLRMTDLGERVVLSASGVSHLVTRLGRDGLVRRTADPEDGRSFFAELTRAGSRRLQDSRPTHDAVVRAHLTDRVTPAQLSRLGDLWEAMLGS